MRITRLRIAGFKSFVEATELRIADGLTGVVGPNGCGKSNLLEAMRWTMGETSARSLRGAGMDDVIFAGTATRPPRDFAEVSILAEIPGDDGWEEREVVRRIERGAGSAYRIDGRDVRARDVALLFADAATGAHSPALVSQGRIGAVIAAKPADRRAMLEEAAGIAGLHVRRREAEARLRATEANLERLDAIIADQDARAAALRRQARAAERYRELSAQVRLTEARMIFARWRDAAAAVDAARREAADADAAVDRAAAAERAASGRQGDAVALLAAARADALAARDRATDADHRHAALLAERGAAERRVAELAVAARRIEADRAREDSLAHDAAEALARIADDLAAIDATIAAATAALPAHDAALVDAERAARDAEVALAQGLARQASDLAERRVATAAHQAARARLERTDRDMAQVAAAIAALAAAEPLHRERDAAAAARVAALAGADEARAALAGAEEGERAALDDRDPAEAARAAALADLAALDGEAAALARTRARRGDRLIDAVGADPGFERALAAALGDELESAADAWTGSTIAADDPAPPAGTLPLAARVAAPPALARRLSQIFLVEIDGGQPLAVGQRLVTRDGRLRRWDGYVAQGGGAAAERLERLNRLAALTAARPALAAAVEATTAARAAIDARIARARQAAQGARALIQQGDAAARDAQRAEDRAAATLDRLAGQHSDLDARQARAAADRAEAAREGDAAAAAVADLPDGGEGDARVAALGREAALHRGAVAAARSARATLDRALAKSRERRAAGQADARGWRARAGEAARRIADMDARAADLAAEAATIADRPAALAEAVAAAAADRTAARAAADALRRSEAAAEEGLRTAERDHDATRQALATEREARAGAAARAESHELRRVEMGRLSGERFECPAPVLPAKAGFEAAAVGTPQDESAWHERAVRDRERIGPVNLVAERELAEFQRASSDSAAGRDELAQAVHRLRGSIGTLNREGRQRLLAAFETVDAHFRRLFATLFDGGAAHLALIDSDDPLEAGLEIMAQPPGKRLQSLTLLSGGEQALTAVALIFGLFLTNPAPICVLDEVDAPLDDANIERFCDLLDRMARETDTRYLVVTHNAVTMSRMHRLFGVTMVERGVSRLVSVDLQAAAGMVG